MTNKRLVQVFLGILYLVVTYGILGPYLISQNNTFAFALGILVTIVIPGFVLVNFKKIFKK